MATHDSQRRRRRLTALEPDQCAGVKFCIARANVDLAAAKRRGVDVDILRAEHLLHNTIDAAREAGADWTLIGDALGIRRGNAYQKFRTIPDRR